MYKKMCYIQMYKFHLLLSELNCFIPKYKEIIVLACYSYTNNAVISTISFSLSSKSKNY